MPPPLTQRWGHDGLPLSAQCVCHVLSVCPAVYIVQAEAAHTRR